MCKIFVPLGCLANRTPANRDIMEQFDHALYEQTLELARNAPRRVKQIDMAKAAQVSNPWVTRFLRGEIKQPAHEILMRLNTFLKGQAQ